MSLNIKGEGRARLVACPSRDFFLFIQSLSFLRGQVHKSKHGKKLSISWASYYCRFIEVTILQSQRCLPVVRQANPETTLVLMYVENLPRNDKISSYSAAKTGFQPLHVTNTTFSITAGWLRLPDTNSKLKNSLNLFQDSSRLITADYCSSNALFSLVYWSLVVRMRHQQEFSSKIFYWKLVSTKMTRKKFVRVMWSTSVMPTRRNCSCESLAMNAGFQ